jgi:hypothetical protein
VTVDIIVTTPKFLLAEAAMLVVMAIMFGGKMI